VSREPLPKTILTCPCGQTMRGEDEDDLVAQVQEHLRREHPTLEYTREQILLMAW
jgi:hypothetical protein